MVKNEKLIGFDGEFRIGFPFVIAEFNFVGAVQKFHDHADLAADQIVL